MFNFIASAVASVIFLAVSVTIPNFLFSISFILEICCSTIFEELSTLSFAASASLLRTLLLRSILALTSLFIPSTKASLNKPAAYLAPLLEFLTLSLPPKSSEFLCIIVFFPVIASLFPSLEETSSSFFIPSLLTVPLSLKKLIIPPFLSLSCS